MSRPQSGPRRFSVLSLVSTNVGTAMLQARLRRRFSRFGGGKLMPVSIGNSQPQEEENGLEIRRGAEMQSGATPKGPPRTPAAKKADPFGPAFLNLSYRLS